MAIPDEAVTSTAVRPSGNAVVDAIFRHTAAVPGLTATQLYRLRASMLLGSKLEGGWGPKYGVGDGGNSWGPYQINLPFHPTMNRQSAVDPDKATAYMLPAYLAGIVGVGRIPDSLWSSDPLAAAEQVAYKAEKPAKLYRNARGYSTVSSAWSSTMSVIGGGSAASPGMGAFPGMTGIAKEKGGTTAAAPKNNDSDCLISLPGIGPLGGNCLLNRGQARGILGGAIVVGGVTLVALGVVLVANKSIAGMVQPVASLIPHPAAQAIAGAAGKDREFKTRRHGVRMTELDAREMAAGARQASAESKLVRAQPGGKGRSVPFTEETVGSDEPF